MTEQALGGGGTVRRPRAARPDLFPEQAGRRFPVELAGRLPHTIGDERSGAARIRAGS